MNVNVVDPPAAEPPALDPPAESPGSALWSGIEVRSHLHRSTDADVYEVYDATRDSVCIAKCARPDKRDSAGTSRRLNFEGELLQRLAHPNIVRGYSVHSDPVGMVLERVQGQSLKAELRQQGDLSWRQLPVLALDLLSALHFLHAEGFLHLDLKPSNVMRAATHTVLLDFNVARAPGPGVKGVGTRLYMAPEQVRVDVLGPAVDVWGLGMVLFRAATGRLPTRGEEEHPQVVHEGKPVRTLRNMPRDLARGIDSCLRPDAAKRPSVSQLREHFIAVRDRLGERAGNAPSIDRTPRA